MAYFDDDDMFPVTRITAGAVGEPGERVFILQAYIEGQAVSWVIDKEQAAALSKVIPRLLEEVHAEYPELDSPLVAARPNLSLSEPLEPIFRVGDISLDYDRMHDLIVFTLVDADGVEIDVEEQDKISDIIEADDEEQAGLQIFATRGQALLLSQQAELVVAAGRPPCPYCGEPIDDFGHFCLPPAAQRKWDSDLLQ